MGFKYQTKLQRLQNIEIMCTEKTSKSLIKSSDPVEPQAPKVTDFSISRILSEDTSLKSDKLKHDKNNTILDLSKHAAPTNSEDYAQQYPVPMYNYGALDFMAATKFYAQFLPQTLSNATTVPRVNLPLANNFPMATNFPILSTFSAAKRYFAPYVFNSEYLSRYANTIPSPLTMSDPLKSHSSSNIATKSATCNRLNCTDCLRDYYSHLSQRIYSGPRSPSIVPENKQLKSSAEIQLSTASSISLTTITNLNFGSSVATTPNKPTSNLGVINPASNSSEEISYKCFICDKVFGCSQTLQAHEKTHKSPRYECADCGKGFSQLRNYKYHLSVHRGTKEFAAECPECGKTFNDKGYLSSHMKIHRNKKEYECPYCPKSFNQRVAFNMHVRIHTGVKPHKCAECGKRFSRKMLLKQHMRTHSGEKPYQCSVCGKSFADRSNMTLHHRLHSGIKPFSCPICPKAFTKKHHLKTHLNYHTGCKPYVCPHPNCNQAFTQSSNMRTHAKKCQYRPLQLASYPAAVSVALPAVATTQNATSVYFSPPIGKNVTASMRFGLSTSAAATTTTALTNLRRLAAPTTTTTAATNVLYPMSAALPLRTTLRPF